MGTRIDGGELGPMHHLGAGYVAGAIMVFATNPVWMIKTRMQLQDNTAKPGAVRPYAGLMGEVPPLSLFGLPFFAAFMEAFMDANTSYTHTREVCIRCGCADPSRAT